MEVFNELLETIEKNAIDNKCTIDNVELFVKSWKKEAEHLQLLQTDVMHRFPDNPEIWKWWKEQRFQKEQGEQEYTMIYEIDLPKILKAFTEHLLNGV